MDVRPVDPRDVRWEVDAPVYRVYFWSGEPLRSDEYELTGAEDVHEVIEWAEQKVSSGSTYTLYAVLERNGEPGLVHLAGVDPTAS